MTKSQVRLRLGLYVAAAILTVVVTEISKLGEADLTSWVKFVAQALLAGVVAARAFVDGSNTMVNSDTNRNY